LFITETLVTADVKRNGSKRDRVKRNCHGPPGTPC